MSLGAVATPGSSQSGSAKAADADFDVVRPSASQHLVLNAACVWFYAWILFMPCCMWKGLIEPSLKPHVHWFSLVLQVMDINLGGDSPSQASDVAGAFYGCEFQQFLDVSWPAGLHQDSSAPWVGRWLSFCAMKWPETTDAGHDDCWRFRYLEMMLIYFDIFSDILSIWLISSTSSCRSGSTRRLSVQRSSRSKSLRFEQPKGSSLPRRIWH